MRVEELEREVDYIADAMRDAADKLDMSFGIFVVECFRRILGRHVLKDIPE